MASQQAAAASAGSVTLPVSSDIYFPEILLVSCSPTSSGQPATHSSTPIDSAQQQVKPDNQLIYEVNTGTLARTLKACEAPANSVVTLGEEIVVAAQQGKPLLHVWAWSKVCMQSKNR